MLRRWQRFARRRRGRKSSVGVLGDSWVWAGGERDVESGVSFVVLKLKPCERGGGEGERYDDDLTYVMLCRVMVW